eukprot:358942-Chlamydomonas_euryale.AAC.2
MATSPHVCSTTAPAQSKRLRGYATLRPARPPTRVEPASWTLSQQGIAESLEPARHRGPPARQARQIACRTARPMPCEKGMRGRSRPTIT